MKQRKDFYNKKFFSLSTVSNDIIADNGKILKHMRPHPSHRPDGSPIQNAPVHSARPYPCDDGGWGHSAVAGAEARSADDGRSRAGPSRGHDHARGWGLITRLSGLTMRTWGMLWPRIRSSRVRLHLLRQIRPLLVPLPRLPRPRLRPRPGATVNCAHWNNLIRSVHVRNLRA